MNNEVTYKVDKDIPSDLLKTFTNKGIVAVDTELEGLNIWRDGVCLIQIADEDQNVSLIKPTSAECPPNLKKLLADEKVIKVFHYALADVVMLQKGLGIQVNNYHCTKIMSKIVRTYTERHSLVELLRELCGIDLPKDQQTSNWSAENLSPEQLRYAANDVLYLIEAYKKLKENLNQRGNLPTGISFSKLNENAQVALVTIVELISNGYGDRDRGWETSIFGH